MTSPAPKRSRREAVSVRVVSIVMAPTGEVIYTPETGYAISPESQVRIARGLLGLGLKERAA